VTCQELLPGGDRGRGLWELLVPGLIPELMKSAEEAVNNHSPGLRGLIGQPNRLAGEARKKIN
jgi:hypothetical protein